ncbi:MAG: FadR family transcriptional regulator [Chloroflexi bacterium]|nr:FadR family transcriptional regulator [Chloroflexota bacterium]
MMPNSSDSSAGTMAGGATAGPGVDLPPALKRGVGDVAGMERISRPDTLTARVVERLTGMILNREVAGGTFLPSEKDLGTSLGVSRTVLREALRVLAGKGLVEIQHGRGILVNPPERWAVVDPQLLLDGGRTTIGDLLAARRLIEGEIASLAAQRANDMAIAGLVQTQVRLRQAADPDEGIQADMEFHSALARAAGNVVFQRILDSIAQLLWAGRKATISVPGAIDRSVRSHQEILDEVVRRDPEAARRAMDRHLGQVEGEFIAAARRRAGLAADSSPEPVSTRPNGSAKSGEKEAL